MYDNERDIFKTLNEHLKKEDVELTVICVGGFVLSHYGMRATVDVDGFFKTTKKVIKAIKEVGDQFGINTTDELWLNNSVQNLNEKPSEDICEVLYTFSNLTVLIPPLPYIAGMKMISARGQDIEDAAAIIRRLQIDSPDDFLKQMKEYNLASIDESILLEAFGQAYGMEWLEKYYIENEEAIQDRIRIG